MFQNLYCMLGIFSALSSSEKLYQVGTLRYEHFEMRHLSPVVQTAKNPSTMRETRVWSLGQEDPLEEGTATHSSILAWGIPWMEELVGSSMGLQSTGHDWATQTHIHTWALTEIKVNNPWLIWLLSDWAGLCTHKQFSASPPQLYGSLSQITLLSWTLGIRPGTSMLPF